MRIKCRVKRWKIKYFKRPCDGSAQEHTSNTKSWEISCRSASRRLCTKEGPDGAEPEKHVEEKHAGVYGGIERVIKSDKVQVEQEAHPNRHECGDDAAETARRPGFEKNRML